MYTPPDSMVNRDFIADTLEGKKIMLKLSQVRHVKVPKYQELSVLNLHEEVLSDPEIRMYFPDSLPKGKLPDREFFFNILATLRPEYVDNLIKFVNEQRMKGGNAFEEAQEVKCTPEWWEALSAMPFISRKYIITSNLFL